MSVYLQGKKSAQPRCLHPSRLTHKTSLGDVVPYPMRCGWCWACEQLRENDLTGQAASESLTCSHIDLVTFTYDSKRSIESRVGAKIRISQHIKDAIQRLRQRERRGIATYNRKEEKDAHAEGRAAKLVDGSRSYIKYVAVHEFGKKQTKRSHWHVLLFFESHFGLPDDLVALADPLETMPLARRVWNVPEIIGPVTRRRPAGASDGRVIDFRVKKDANQEWDLWPHGQVNVARLTHDVNNLKNGLPVLKPAKELAEGVRYVFKYMRKNVKIPKTAGHGEALHVSAWTQKEREAFYASQRAREVSRTRSMGLGAHYADVWGRQRARKGGQITDFCYRISGHEMRRGHRSVTGYQQKLQAAGVSEFNAERLTERRKLFEMRGAMRETAFAAYYDEKQARRKKPLTLSGLGPMALQCVMKRETDEFNTFLRSHGAACLRAVQSEVSKGRQLLPDALDPVHVYERDRAGNLLDGQSVDGRRKKIKFRKPEDRLAERRAAIASIKRRYEHAATNTKKLDRLKQAISRENPVDWETEIQFANRPEFERQRFRRKVDLARLQDVMKELHYQSLNDDAAKEELDWLADFIRTREKDVFGRPRHDVWHPMVSTAVLWRWINGSDDFHWRSIRNDMIWRHCAVNELDAETRVIVNPHGETFIQRIAFSDEKASFECPNTGQIIRHANFKRWATRKAASPEEIERALAGDLPNRSPMDRDAIFRGPEPLLGVSQRDAVPWYGGYDDVTYAESQSHMRQGNYVRLDEYLSPHDIRADHIA